MQTLLELLQNMSHSTLSGMIGVSGIVLFFLALVGAAVYRIREQQEQDDH